MMMNKGNIRGIAVLCIGLMSVMPILGAGVQKVKAATTSTVTAAVPRHAGKVTLKIFKCGDAQCTHGVSCEVTVTITQADIDANLSAAQKAAKIEAAIDASTCGVDVVRTGAVLTITSEHGQEITKATDSTGEVMLADNDGVGVPVTYTTKAKLTGETTEEGLATLGENGIFHTVETFPGQSIEEIYQAWAEVFGEGTFDENGFALPERSTIAHGFGFEVTDPGLTIEVTQETDNPLPNLPAFVDALFGQNTNPDEIAAFDLNNDGLVNGEDIESYINALMEQ
ncbi:MAG: hypothetical protein MI923_03795 [Phycisphaerales bacterium]|nr:hypothetical protein [Phycisphaerales bacterium]